VYPWSCIAFRIGAGRFSFENGMFWSHLFFGHQKSEDFRVCSRTYVLDTILLRIVIYAREWSFIKVCVKNAVYSRISVVFQCGLFKNL
jgi:hypothetical protein